MDNERPMAELARLRERYTEWRRTRTKLGPIPADLLKETFQLLEVLPFGLVQRELRLDYTTLKKRHAIFLQNSCCAPRFVELKLPVPSGSGDKVLAELIRGDGLRFRIFSPEASPLLREFLRS